MDFIHGTRLGQLPLELRLELARLLSICEVVAKFDTVKHPDGTEQFRSLVLEVALPGLTLSMVTEAPKMDLYVFGFCELSFGRIQIQRGDGVCHQAAEGRLKVVNDQDSPFEEVMWFLWGVQHQNSHHLSPVQTYPTDGCYTALAAGTTMEWNTIRPDNTVEPIPFRYLLPLSVVEKRHFRFRLPTMKEVTSANYAELLVTAPPPLSYGAQVLPAVQLFIYDG